MKNILSLIFIVIFLFHFSSCNQDDLSQIKNITISSSKNNVLIDEEVSFTAMSDIGTDVTTETTFYINGNKIQGNTFIPNQIGVFTVLGKYNTIQSNQLEVTVSVPTGYSQKVLVEDYTGVWCGYCPRVAYAIQQIETDSLYEDKIIPVAIHLYENNDPYFCEDGGALKDAFQISGLPQGRINRTISWTSPQETNIDQVTSLIGNSAPLGIAMDTSIENNQIVSLIRVGFAQDFTNLGIVVYLLENGLIHNQTNYTDLFGGAYILENFEHNDVLRKVYTSIYGDEITATESVNGNVFEYSLEQNLPDNIENADNLSMVVFVVDKSTNTVINAQHVHVGDNQSFD